MIFSNLLVTLLPLGVVVALVALIIGAATYAMKRNDVAGKLLAKKIMTGGGIGLGVLLVLWVLLGAMQSSLGLSGSLAMAPSYDSMIDSSFSKSAPSYGGVTQNGADRRESAYESDMAMMPPVPGGESAPAGNSKIIKNATLTLLVDSVETSALEVARIRSTFGGQPGNASISDYSSYRKGEITIWIPSEKFDEALGAIKKLALQVQSEQVTVTDVSAQFVDMEARIKNLKVTEAQIVELMKRSGKISEVLEVSRELSNTRQQIEQLQGQLNYLSRQVALSSVHIYMTEEVSPGEVKNEWRPISVIKSATKDMLKSLTSFVDDLIVMLVWLPVFLLRLAFWVFVAWVIWRTLRFVYARFRGPSALPPSSGRV